MLPESTYFKSIISLCNLRYDACEI